MGIELIPVVYWVSQDSEGVCDIKMEVRRPGGPPNNPRTGR